MFQAGAAAVDITPERNIDLTGFIARSNPMTGVRDPIWVRALWLAARAGAPALILAVDALALDNDFCRRMEQRIARSLGIPGQGIMIAATHTHSAPAVINLRRCGEPDHEWVRFLEQGVLRAAESAAASAVPARLFAASGPEPDLIRNRRDPGSPTDPELTLLTLKPPGGTPVASLVGFACHPVALRPWNTMVSPDYPAGILAELEPESGVGLFLTGPCGNINPIDSDDPGFYLGMGRALGRAAAGLFHRLEPVRAHEIRAGQCEVGLDYADPPPVRELGRLKRGLERELDGCSCAVELRDKRAMVDWASALIRAVEGGGPPRSLDCRLKALAVGDLVVVGIGAEPFVEMGLALKSAFPDKRVLPVTCANGNVGYLPPAEAFDKGWYETDSAYKYYGLCALERDSHARALEAAIRMISGLVDPVADNG